MILKLGRKIKRYRRLLLIAATHLVFVVISYFLAFYIRFEFSLSQEYIRLILTTLPMLIIIKMPIFHYFGIFRGLWRYVSIDDMWQILKAATTATVCFILWIVFLHGLIGFPRSVFVLDWIFLVTFIGGSRILIRSLRENFHRDFARNYRNVLIVGAGQCGVLMLREYRSNFSMGVHVVGFIDDDPAKKNRIVYGVKVLGGRKDIPEAVKKYRVNEILLAIPSANGETIRTLLSYCKIPGIRIQIVPGLDKILNGELQVKPRDVQPEDLLGRETVEIKESEISSYLKGKTVLVTGAGGSIGSALCRRIVTFGPRQLIMLDNNENNVYFLTVSLHHGFPQVNCKTVIGDIKDIRFLMRTFSTLRPQVVFHAAAHKHVPLMEDNPCAAVKNNVLGTRNVISASVHYSAERFVLISTDKAVNPTSVMGATKRIAEMILQARAKRSRTKLMAVRFGNVLGSDGSVIPLFKKQIAEGGPVTVTHPDARRYFMSAKEAAELVLQAGSLGNGGEIFILDMGEQIKIADLAKNLIILSGLEPDKDIKISYTGLRPGEKLCEEIFLEIEKTKTTALNKIFIIQPHDFNPTTLRLQVRSLERLSQQMRNEQVIKKIKEIIPSYGTK